MLRSPREILTHHESRVSEPKRPSYAVALERKVRYEPVLLRVFEVLALVNLEYSRGYRRHDEEKKNEKPIESAALKTLGFLIFVATKQKASDPNRKKCHAEQFIVVLVEKTRETAWLA
jgi:hypothetical protein